MTKVEDPLFIKENALSRKKELEDIVVPQNWKFTQLITGFSIGILAFSVQTLEKINENINDYDCTVILLISFILLFLAFFFGLGRLHFLKKGIQKDYKYVNKLSKTDVYDEKRKLKKNHYIANKKIAFTDCVCSNIMSYSFLFGIIAYTLFLIINIPVETTI